MLSGWGGGNKERFRRIEEIAHEIREDVDDCFSHREFCAYLVPHHCKQLRGSEDELPPATDFQQGGRRVIAGHKPSHLKEAFIVLKPCPVLNTSEVAIPIVVQNRRDFR